MKWKKHGQIFCANNSSDYMYTGGRTPVPLWVKDNIFKVFFASYDKEGRGRIFSLLFDIEKPQEILELQKNPLLDLGHVGFYDDNGIIPSWLLTVDDKLYLYTIGFSVKNKLIFDAATGLAISNDGGKSFEKLNGPVIDRTVTDPCFAASPCVMRDNGKFKMWYVSCDRWEALDNGKYKHYYNIKYKESQDGIYWEPKATIAIDYQNKYEYAISRPTVVKDGPQDYKMWYSYRAQKNVDTYRLGYATSKDGIQWTRKDQEVGIDVSPSGWDSEMICYPCVFDHNGRRYLFYNGNGYGRSGFGLAELEKD